MNWLTHPLNTPLKRSAALVLLVSSIWLGYELVQVFDRCGYSSLWRETECLGSHWLDVVLGARSHRYEGLRWPTIAVLGSLALSYAYDVGIGRVVRWVMGSPARE